MCSSSICSATAICLYPIIDAICQSGNRNKQGIEHLGKRTPYAAVFRNSRFAGRFGSRFAHCLRQMNSSNRHPQTPRILFPRFPSIANEPPAWAFSAADAESKTCAYRLRSVLLLCVRCFSSSKACGRGGIGRRARFRFWWATPVKVQVLSPAPAGGRVLFLHPSPSFFLRSLYI